MPTGRVRAGLPQRDPPRTRPVQAVDPLQTDVFFEAFRLARLNGELVREGVLRNGPPLRYPHGRAMFHFVREAGCVFAIESASGRRLRVQAQPGELLILPHGSAHRIEAGATAAHATAPHLTSGAFVFEALSGVPLMRALPELLHVPAAGQGEDSPAQWLALSFEAMRRETRQPSIGSRIMIARLIDMVFIWAVRHWLAQAPAQHSGWLSALRDPLVARALALLHAQPAHAWTVDELAARLHQSRSALGQRFAERVGEPPMRYLAAWRMQLAADLLLRTDLRVSQVAGRVGYGSEAAFSRSFRRAFGQSPSDYRRRLCDPFSPTAPAG
ncbi:AraC family transcriptional regulator [Lysobacter firmicutimachus]|uniref:AraC family transcriptional regulator n=1 Tax=Lysobacter firmicutimachus TaxID=1792846 RepID=A0AAU8MRM2_9GAMM